MATGLEVSDTASVRHFNAGEERRDEVPKTCCLQVAACLGASVGASSAPEANHSVQRVSKLCAITEGVASLQRLPGAQVS